MKTWQKILCVALALLLIICLSEIDFKQRNIYAENEKYYVLQNDGKFFLEFKEPQWDPWFLTSANAAVAASYPEFLSVGQMRDAILTGSFTASELAQVRKFHRAEDYTVPIVDLTKLYDATLPSGVILDRIAWENGTEYKVYFNYAKSEKNTCYMLIKTGEPFSAYATLPHKEYVNKEFYEGNNSGYIFLREEALSDRNATAYYLTYTGGTLDKNYVDVYYELQKGDVVLYVKERYKDNLQNAPSNIRISGMQDNCYFMAYITGFTRRPTEDWLLSFGLKPYVE